MVYIYMVYIYPWIYLSMKFERKKTIEENSLGICFFQQRRPELIAMATLHEGQSSMNRW